MQTSALSANVSSVSVHTSALSQCKTSALSQCIRQLCLSAKRQLCLSAKRQCCLSAYVSNTSSFNRTSSFSRRRVVYVLTVITNCRQLLLDWKIKHISQYNYVANNGAVTDKMSFTFSKLTLLPVFELNPYTPRETPFNDGIDFIIFAVNCLSWKWKISVSLLHQSPVLLS